MQWILIPHPNVKVEGLAFFQEEQIWNRLPKTCQERLAVENPAMEELSHHTAGAALHFRTNSKTIHIDVTLTGPAYMSHMSATGIAGLDCYVRVEGEDKWQFKGVTKFPIQDSSYQVELAIALPVDAEVLINLPLYIGVKDLKIGLDDEATITLPPESDKEQSIVFYGTSITQGACASRPGMAYPAILRRRWDMPVYNFGFSGNARGEAYLADVFMRSPNIGLFVIDIEANAGPLGTLAENLPLFIESIRTIDADLPILVVSGTAKTFHRWNEVREKEDSDFPLIEADVVDKKREAGDERIYYFNANTWPEELANECTVDGVHLTDLGLYTLANELSDVIEAIFQDVYGIFL